jgi:hypothetical protein
VRAALRIGVAIAVVAVLVIAAIFLIGRVTGSSRHSSDRRTQSVIAAALKASGFGTHEFPATVGTRRCIVRGGGPAPGASFVGTCKTGVRLHRGGAASVYFTHVIDGGPHTWVYVVSSSLHVRLLRHFGPGIAPEYWA